MRISDWSSDVCSSDLLDVGEVVEEAGQRAGDQLAERVAQQPGLVEELAGVRVLAGPDELPGGVAQQVPQPRDGRLGQDAVAGGDAGEDRQRVAHDVGHVGAERPEGSTVWREKGGANGSIMGVVGTLKKK